MASLASLSQLSEEQKIAFDKFKKGDNLFITGSGGTGKSKLIQEFVKYCNDIGKTIQVCALTGCAAVLLENCNAITIHSFSGIGYMNVSDDKILDKVYRNFRVKKMWKEVEVLVIDEVSMMSKRMFELLEKIGRMLRNKPGYFGGIQVIFTGDFFQLPPIGENNNDTEFCFETEHWFDIFPTENNIELTKIFRQNDQQYIDILYKIRRGILDEDSIECLSTCINRPVNNAHAITQLFPLKNKVDAINRIMFSKICEQPKIFEFEFDFNGKKYLNDCSQIEPAVLQKCNDLNEEFKQREMEKLLTSYNFVKSLELKVGAVVMCTKNICVEAGICNGSQGIIEEIRADGPIVRFNNGIKQVINKIWVQSTEYPSIMVSQIPICLAWAITIHKIQGITLDSAMIDVGNTVFEYGQTYVALSRIKSLSGLHLINFDAKKIKANPKVIDFYNHMKDEREKRDMVVLSPQTNTTGGRAPRGSAQSAAAAAAIQRAENSQRERAATQPIHSFFQKKEKEKKSGDDDVCPICLNKCSQACTTQCGHKYCVDCLTKHWKSKNGKLDCPYCRQRITVLIPDTE